MVKPARQRCTLVWIQFLMFTRAARKSPSASRAVPTTQQAALPHCVTKGVPQECCASSGLRKRQQKRKEGRGVPQVDPTLLLTINEHEQSFVHTTRAAP